MMYWIIRWLISAVAIMLASYVLPGVVVSGFAAALMAALVLGLLNTFIRPVFILLTLPLTILTLGLFTFVINALLILFVSALVPGFAVLSFGWALLFSLVLSLVNMGLNRLVKVQ